MAVDSGIGFMGDAVISAARDDSMTGTATAYLRILNGDLKGGVFVLSDLSLFEVGRAEGCHVRIPDPECGMTQGRITRSGNGSWRFLNLNDERRAFVNDIPVDSRPLSEGDILRFGSTELHFSFQAPRTKSEAESPAAETPAADAAAPRAAAPIPSTAPAPAAEMSDDFDMRTELDLPAVGRSAPAAFKIVVIDGNESDLGREFHFGDGDECIVGRSISADFVLMDGKISRNHCSVKLERGHLVLTDLGSSNGTVVNGERVQKTVLADGDYVRLGFTVLGCSVTREPVA